MSVNGTFQTWLPRCAMSVHRGEANIAALPFIRCPTFAPADDGALSEDRYPAIGNMLVPTEMNWFDDPASSVNAVGVDETGNG